MGEYQYYQFDAVTHLLSEREQSEVGSLSSHISVNSSSAYVEYHYSDFRHDAIEVLEQHFDVLRYGANWGTLRLAFRFDEQTVDFDAIGHYAFEDVISIYRRNENVVIDAYFSEETEYEYYVEGAEGGSNPFLFFHQEIMEGDYRSLFLMWLKAANISYHWEEADEDCPYEVPVPAGLKTLNAAHQELGRFIELESELIEAAETHSEPLIQCGDFATDKTLSRLSAQEQRQFLKKLATESPQETKSKLVRRLKTLQMEMDPSKNSGPKKESFRFKVLRDNADQSIEERKTREREKAEHERLEYLERIERDESELWKSVHDNIQTKNIKGYDEAILILQRLKELAEHRTCLEAFERRVSEIYMAYPRLSGLRWRLKAGGLIEE